MTTHEEQLQRLFDNDLSDKELKSLCTALGASAALREEFRSFQQMRSGLHTMDHIPVPESLDRRVESLTTKIRIQWPFQLPSLSRFFSLRIPVPAAALITVLAVMLFGSLFVYQYTISRQPVTQYVYVYEMQPVVVQSHYVQ